MKAIEATISRTLRVLLIAALLLGLGLVPRPAPVRAAVSFADQGALGLPAARYGSVAWGDYDNDGRLDVLVAGCTDGTCTTRIARVYHNNGSGNFTDASAGLPGVAYSAAAWGDYDGDGRLDILLAGNTGSARIAKVYHNNGDGTFTDSGASLAGVDYAAAAWGDYDNDGDLDLLLSGDTGSARVSKLYRNDGGGAFAEVSTNLVGVSRGAVAWGDYDNDGDLDILLAGYAAPAVSKVYRNDGNGVFTDIGAGLLGLDYASAAWGDYDNDGDLDILLAGLATASTTKLYRNDGNGTFTDAGGGLPGVERGAVAWGDYDSDGDLDVLLTGVSGSKETTSVYRNNGDGTFSDTRARLTGLSDSSAAWGDYDNDGDLDILVAGYTGSACAIKVYRTDGAAANTAPGAPAGLAAALDGFSAALSWSAASDAQTPAAGLTYNLRVGTTPGGGEVMPAMADASTGWRRVPQLGNADQGTTARLRLPFGTYYWSVQAVDSGFAGGAFAAESSFTIAPSAPGAVALAGPSTGQLATTYAFTATVGPETVEMPLTYLWEATGQTPVTHEVSSRTDSASYNWAMWGTKLITVTVSNALGTAWATHTMQVQLPPAFTDVGTLGLEPVGQSTVAWGDYDSDGDLDILLGGDTASGASIARVYHNDGGAFTDIGAGLPGASTGDLAWGDYDNDGDLDIAEVGSSGPSVHRNNGGTFSHPSPGSAFSGATIAWGDYDRDGDLDLLLTGVDSSGPLADVFRNDRPAFPRLWVGFPGIDSGGAAWGDYDNDGDLDVALAGYTGSSGSCGIYRNDGNGVFTNINAGLQAVLWACVAWGDYDNDGDLDLLVGGRADGSLVRLARVYRNDSNGVFTDIAAGLVGASAGSLAWGDYDNDGDLDILLTGKYDPAGEVTARVYRNDGADTFTDISAGLPGVDSGDAAWGDYDNDGDLDILLTGTTPSGRIVRIFRNNTAEIGQANTVPAAPAGLSAAVHLRSVTLSWGPASDAETPSGGLSYNLRVGRAPGAQDALAPMADMGNGWRRLPQIGNAGHLTSASLSLAPGTYYWSVQAVDTAFAGGPFAAEGTFVIPYPPAQVSVAGPAASALNVAQAFTATVTPVDAALPITYTWRATGQQTVTHPAVPGLTDLASFTWAVTGRKGVTVTATNALGTATGSYSFTVYPPPQAGFTGSPTVGPAPLTVAFANTSSGEIAGQLWEFGDGITSTLQGPTHTYTLPGVYTVTLTVTGPGGSDVETKPSYVTVRAPSQAAFTAAPTAGIAPLAVAFTNTSTGEWTSCQWWFGDGITSTLESPTHTYSVGGTYTVTLSVSGPGGSDTETRPALVTAYRPVDADFIAVPFFGPAPFTAAFTNTSTGDWTACLWEFGDAITSTLESPTHTYTIPGTYTVTLTVDGPGGHDVKTSAGYILVYAPVQAGFTATPTVGVVPMAVVFTNTSTGDYIATDWTFGDGITSTLESPTHTYMLPGVYTVTLTASGPGGSDAEVKPGLIAAYPPVLASFDAAPTAGPAPLTVVFTNTSTGEFTASLWDFGDAITSTLPSPTHTYTAGGVYTVTLFISGPHDTDTRVASRLISAYAGMPEPGPQRTDLSLQDLGPAPAPVNLAYTGEEGGLTRRYDLGLRIPVKAAHRIVAAELEPAVSGAWAGSAQVLSTQPLATVVQAFWEYPSGARAAAAYAGPQAPATTIHLPFLGFLDGLLGRIVVQNAEEAEAHLTIHFYDRRGVEVLVHSATVPPHAERSFSLAVLQPDLSASGGYGSARIVSDRDVVAVAVLNWSQAAEAYAGVTAGDTALWLPGFTRRQAAGGWDHSQAAIRNLGTVSATVHLELIDPDGSLRHALDDEIPARGAAAYNTCEQGTLDAARFQALAAALGTDWQGTLKVTCTNAQPLAGFALGWAPGVGVTDTLGYNAIPAGAAAGKGLAFPAVSRRLTGGADEEWSLALVHNTAGTSGTVGVEFFGADGAKVGETYTIAIPANGSLRLSLKDGLDLPQAALDALGTGFAGAMYLTPSTGVQLAGVAESFWPGEGRASGYAGSVVP